MWSFKGFIPDSAFVQCDLDLQSLKAKRPYYTDKLAATTRIRVQSECLIYFLTVLVRTVTSRHSVLWFSSFCYIDRLYLSFDSQ